MAAAFHTYSVAGNYNAIINVSDSLGVFRSDTYKVQVYSVTPTFAIKWRAFVEGQGLVANLSRQTNLGQPIVAYIFDNTTYPVISPSVTWYMDSWANPILTQSFTKTVFPGEYFPMIWPGNVPQVITAAGTHQFWVKTTCFGCTGANVTSPKMTVVYSSAVIAPSLTATVLTGSVNNLQPGQAAIIKYRLTNPSSFTINWFDAATLTSGAFVFPDPPVTALQFGPVINGSIQTYILQPGPVNNPPAATDQGNFPITNLGYLLAPGQNVTITQEVNNPLTSNNQLSGGLQVVFTPYIAASCTAPTTSAGASCAFAGNPVTATTTVTTGGPAPASITTGFGQQIGNGSVVLVGFINSMGVNAVIQVWFQFTVPNGTAFITPTQLISGPTTVRQYLYGLPTGNFTLTMLGITGGGQSLNGGTVSFTVGIQSGLTNPNSNGQNAAGNFLYSIATVLNMPAIFVGFIFGTVLMIAVFGMLFSFSYYFEADVPESAWLIALLIMTGVNIGLFLWPDWLALVIFTVIGLMLWDAFRGPSGAGGESGG